MHPQDIVDAAKDKVADAAKGKVSDVLNKAYETIEEYTHGKVNRDNIQEAVRGGFDRIDDMTGGRLSHTHVTQPTHYLSQWLQSLSIWAEDHNTLLLIFFLLITAAVVFMGMNANLRKRILRPFDEGRVGQAMRATTERPHVE